MANDKSLVEKVASNPLTGAAMALIAATNPDVTVGVLLPVLVGSLGFIEADRRIKSCLAEINAGLHRQKDQLNRFSEAQMRLTVGIIQTVSSTVEAEKLRLLKAAVLNVAGSDYLEHHEAQEFNRILRDISAADIAFLVRHRGVGSFNFRQGDNPPRDGLVSIRLDSPDHAIARNLITLGILIRSPDEGTMADIGAYSVAPHVPRLLKLIEDTPVED